MTFALYVKKILRDYIQNVIKTHFAETTKVTKKPVISSKSILTTGRQATNSTTQKTLDGVYAEKMANDKKRQDIVG